MWRRHLIILPSFIFYYVCIINSFFPGYEKYELPPIHTFHRQLIVRNDPKLEVRQQRYMRSLKKNSLNNIIKIKEPLIYFKDEEIKIGYNYLKKIGVHENNFICFNARDRAFLNKYNRDRDWSYHDFRNSDIYNYLPAMEKMVKKNFFCLRTGLAVENKLICSNQKIIDYANSEDQSDLLDVFLGSKCRFYLLSGSGISLIPEVFNRPIIFVNHYNINEILAFSHNSLYIPKKYYSIEKQRLLTFKEFIDLEIKTNFTVIHENNFFQEKTFQEQGIKMIDNTSEEIADVVMEMDARLNGTWKTDKEEEDLQNIFWSLFKYKFIKSPTFRIGSSFLKKNQSLLK
jgi:putative glycosyltransferase (TIGR04372 family)